MSHNVDINDTGRDFSFNAAGLESNEGVSIQVPVDTPTKAIARVNALDPAPSSSLPASINASVTGTYFTGVTIPDFVTCNSAFASIIIAGGTNVECGNRQSVDWGALLNLGDGGICTEIVGRSRVAVENNAMVVGTDGNIVNQRDTRIAPSQLASTGNIGFLVDGSCSEIFCSVVSAIIGGEGAKLIQHTATSPNPVEYIVGNVEFFNENQIFIDFNPPNASDQAVVNASSIQPSADAISTAGSIAYRARNGRLIADDEVVSAESLLVADANSRAALDLIVAFGNLLISDTAQADFSSEILVGDIALSDTAILTTTLLNHVGDISVASGAKLSANILGHTGKVSPSAPGAGPINALIDNRRYGDRRVLDEILLIASDTTQQDPTTTDTPLQVTFGPSQRHLSADGTITIREKNQYFFRFELQLGRDVAGGVAFIFFRVLVDGVQEGESTFWKLDGPNDDVEVTIITDALELDGGQEVTLEMIRDSTGMDDGSLMVNTPVLGDWTPSRSAIVRMWRRS